MLPPGSHEQSWGQCNGLHKGAKAKGCELALRPGQRWALTSRLRGYHLGSRSLWVPRLPDSIPVQVEPREWMGIIQ